MGSSSGSIAKVGDKLPSALMADSRGRGSGVQRVNLALDKLDVLLLFCGQVLERTHGRRVTQAPGVLFKKAFALVLAPNRLFVYLANIYT